VTSRPSSVAAVRHEVADASSLSEGQPYGSGKPLPVSTKRPAAGGAILMDPVSVLVTFSPGSDGGSNRR
jgi:hypothetical protein